MSTSTHVEADSLTSLEDRILKAVELVSQLRKENATLTRERDEAVSAHTAAQALAQRFQTEAGEAQGQAARLAEELDAVRGEQKQVRKRVEKLLEMIDSLGA